jgi:hypothetical protein
MQFIKLPRTSDVDWGATMPLFGRTQYFFGLVVLTLNVTYSSVLFVRCREHEICFFNSKGKMSSGGSIPSSSLESELIVGEYSRGSNGKRSAPTGAPEARPPKIESFFASCIRLFSSKILFLEQRRKRSKTGNSLEFWNGREREREREREKEREREALLSGCLQC